MEIVECLTNGNWSCLTDWSISNTTWLLVEVTVIGVLLKGVLLPLFSALYMTPKIVKNNRGEPGSGFGTRAADLFLMLWSSDRRYDDTEKEHLGNASRTFVMGNVAERHLVPLKLAEVYTDQIGIKKIRVVKNMRNKFVRFFVQRLKNITKGM